MAMMIAGNVIFPFDQPLLVAGQRLSPYMDVWHGLSESANFPLIAVGIAIVVGLLLFRRWREATRPSAGRCRTPAERDRR